MGIHGLHGGCPCEKDTRWATLGLFYMYMHDSVSQPCARYHERICGAHPVKATPARSPGPTLAVAGFSGHAGAYFTPARDQGYKKRANLIIGGLHQD